MTGKPARRPQPDLMGGPEPDEEATGVMEGRDPGQRTGVMEGRDPGQRTDVVEGRDPGERTDVVDGPEREDKRRAS